MTTTFKLQNTIKRTWYQIDAAALPLGRLSTKISRYLTGKQHADYTPFSDMGDYVVVINASNLKFSGRKFLQKKYTRFSGYPGGIKTRFLKDVVREKPEFVIREAVRGMLPKNKPRALQLRRLKIFPGKDHDFKQVQILK